MLSHIKNLVNKSSLRYFLLLNFAMLCISTSGVFGSSLFLFPPLGIWFRCLIAALLLLGYCKFKGFDFNLEQGRSRQMVFLSGILMAGHWVFYFFALLHTSVAISMIAIFTYPMITTFLEPLFFKVKLEFRSILLSGLIMFGLYYLLPTFSIENADTLGFLFAIASAFTYSIRNLIMKKEIEKYNGSVLMFYQCVIAVVILLPFFFYSQPSMGDVIHDLPFLLGLGLITTCLGHTIFLNTFSYFRISTASILSSLQPVFGITLAIIFLQEGLDMRTLVGGLIIMSTVLIESLASHRKKTK